MPNISTKEDLERYPPVGARSGHYDGGVWIEDKPLREIVNLLQALPSQLEPLTSQEWVKLEDELAALGLEAFTAKYQPIFCNPGLNQTKAKEDFNRSMRMLLTQIRADSKRYTDMLARQNSAVNQPCILKFNEDGMFGLQCGHPTHRDRMRALIADANGNDIVCLTCGKKSNFKKTRKAFERA